MNAPTNAADFKDVKGQAPKATDSKFIGALLAILLSEAFQKDRTDQAEKPSPAPEAQNTKAEASGDNLVRDVGRLGAILMTELPERLTVEGGEKNPVTTATRILLEQKYEILAMRKQIEAMQAGNMVETADGMVCVHHLVEELAGDLIGKQAIIDFLSDKLDLPTD